MTHKNILIIIIPSIDVGMSIYRQRVVELNWVFTDYQDSCHCRVEHVAWLEPWPRHVLPYSGKPTQKPIILLHHIVAVIR